MDIDALDVLSVDPWLTPRRFVRFLRKLPPESATVAEYRGGQEYQKWDWERYALATMIDQLNLLLWVIPNKDRKRPKPQPKQIDRPGKQSKPSSGLFRSMAMAHLDKVKGMTNG